MITKTTTLTSSALVEIRFYPARQFFVTTNILGMYFFGYGNFISSQATIGVKLTKHIAAHGGNQLGSRFNVNTKPKQVGLSLNQKGRPDWSFPSNKIRLREARL